MPVLIVLGILAAIAVAVVRYRLKQQRIADLTLVAKRLEMAYTPEDPFELDRMAFRLFSRGDGRGCENVMTGQRDGAPVLLFDYWYFDESTDSEGRTSRSYRRFTCAIVEVEAAFPRITIGRESVFSRLADGLGFRDIEFESEEFNRAFQVKSPDRRFASYLCDPRMMAWLMDGGTEWSYEVMGRKLLVYTGKRSPEEWSALLDRALAFRATIPAVALEEFKLQREGEQ